MDTNTDVRPLPTALLRRRNRQLAAGIIALILSVAVIIYFGTRMVAVLILPAYLFWMAATVAHDYNSGAIAEFPLICTGVKSSYMRDQTIVDFRSAGEPPVYYQFSLPGRQRINRFIKNSVYVVYYHIDNPNIMIDAVAVAGSKEEKTNGE